MRRLLPAALPSMPRFRFRQKLALWFGGVVLLSTGISVGLSYKASLDQMIDEFGKSLIAIANAGADDIDPRSFQSLAAPEQMKSETYKSLHAKLASLAQVADNSGIKLHYLYTMAPTGKPGTWRYVIDSQPELLPDGKENPEFSALGDTETYPPSDVINRCYHTGEPRADKDLKPYPHWGELMTVAVPIFDEHHKVIGIVGADAPPKAVTELKDKMRAIGIVCLGAGLIVVIVGSSIVAVQVTKPVDALVVATEKIAEGDLNYEVRIAGHDEMAQLGDAFNKMTAGLRLRDLYKHQFGRYVSRQIAEAILSQPERDFWQGERRRATIMFSDIRGFTTMSEKLPPEEVVNRLNEYLTVMVDIVFAYDGTLDKFIGDAIMAVFGAPVSTGNDEERAVRAAISMQEAAVRLEKLWSSQGRTGFKIGIGINTGDIVVGNIGSDQRLEYAAIGDHVNLASRLEALNKEYKTNILITEDTYRPIEHLVEVRWVDKVAVRGKTESVNIYEVLRLKEGAPPFPTDRV